MLRTIALEEGLKEAIEGNFKPAIQTLLTSLIPIKSDMMLSKIEQCAEGFSSQISSSLAHELATAIESFIKSADVVGSVTTAGSPTSQTAKYLPFVGTAESVPPVAALGTGILKLQ